MENLGGLLNAALAIVAVATLSGLGLMRGTVTGLRERLNDYEKEVSEKDRRITALEKSDVEKTNALDVLSRTVTGEVHWVALGETLDHHHAEAKAHWEKDEQTLADILTELRGGTS